MDPEMNPFGSPNRSGAALAFVALAIAARAVAADGPPRTDAPRAVASERAPGFSPIAVGPLLEVVEAQRTPAAPDVDPFARLAPDSDTRPSPLVAVVPGEVQRAPAPTTKDLDAAATASRPIDIPLRSASPAPDPVPTAIAAALARLIVHDGPVNPLGAGDWRAARAAIGAFYADRDFRPVWVDEGGLTPAGRSALRQLGRAAEDGLNLSAFALPRDLAARLGPDDLARNETTIAAAIVAYAEQATGSRVPPSRISWIITAEPSVADPGAALAETAATPDPAARLGAFNPPQKSYRELRDELKRLSEASADRSRRTNRTALDLSLDDPSQSLLVDGDADDLSDPKIDGAPRRVKTRPRNGAFTASADPARSGQAARRRAAILANMEMWRWEPRAMGERRIEVNVADYSVSVLEGDTVIHRARVVVGKPDTPTPIFSNVMRYVLINPSWRVPDSIIKKEMMSKLGYLSHHGYEVKTVDGRVTVRQLPGDDNALGRLAFMFPNEHSVYLHDTPSQALFDADMRAFSHGCVRVEDPLRLAELVLGWSESRINAAIGGPEREVLLPSPLPIHIEYFTEFVDEFGDLQERPDVYGLMRKVADTLSIIRQD
jgi:L,D-transpeptidase YcbB